MKSAIGYYSLIQYVPNPTRAEVVNIGVLLFCPSLNYIDVQHSEGNDRVAKMFGRDSFDRERINETKTAIRRRFLYDKESFREIDDLKLYISSLANEIRISEPRLIKVINPEIELNNLFKELVGGRKISSKGSQNAFRRLREQIKRSSLHNRIMTNYKVEVPISGRSVPVRSLTVDYAYKNGSLNLVKTELFNVDIAGIDKAFRIACEGDLIQRHGGNGLKQNFIVVADVPDTKNATDIRDKIVGVFGEYKIRSVWESEIDRFVDEIDKEAH